MRTNIHIQDIEHLRRTSIPLGNQNNSGVTYLDCFDAATGNFCYSIQGGGGSGAFGRQNFKGTDGSLLQLYLSTATVGGKSRQSLNSMELQPMCQPKRIANSSTSNKTATTHTTTA